MSNASPKELWRVVKDISGTTRLNSKSDFLLKDTDTVNAFFANISSNSNYNRDVVNEYLYFAITAAKSHTKTKIQQTNIHNTSSNAKKRRKKRKKHTIRLIKLSG